MQSSSCEEFPILSCFICRGRIMSECLKERKLLRRINPSVLNAAAWQRVCVLVRCCWEHWWFLQEADLRRQEQSLPRGGKVKRVCFPDVVKNNKC